jgi:hypothetical protein
MVCDLAKSPTLEMMARHARCLTKIHYEGAMRDADRRTEVLDITLLAIDCSSTGVDAPLVRQALVFGLVD